MARTVRHFGLHRIASTELRVVSDVEDGVLPVVQQEEEIIRGYARYPSWPHRWVTLFVLQDLAPLARQLEGIGGLPGPGLLPGGTAFLEQRPVVNIYDLADLDNCHVFVNQQRMERETYWRDSLAMRGLLAHEHAHPLAENGTTRAARQVQVTLKGRFDPATGAMAAADRQTRVLGLLEALAGKLCVLAPRELFANECSIASGFGDALLHLDRRNVAQAAQAIAGRDYLVQRLQQETERERLPRAAADLLLLIGDLDSYLDLVLEVAPFYRAGRGDDARRLESVLETEVFPHLDRQVAQVYAALREVYISLPEDLSPERFADWVYRPLDLLASALAEKGLTLRYSLRTTEAIAGQQAICSAED